MAKTKRLAAPEKAVDPSLAALFSESVGPAKPMPKSRYSEPQPPKVQEASESEDESEDEGDDEELSELDEEFDDEASNSEGEDGSEEESSALEEESGDDVSEDDEAEASEVQEPVVSTTSDAQEEPRKRKRKQRDEHEDLESAYFQKLAEEDEPSGKRMKGVDSKAVAVDGATADDDDDESMSDIPVHESVAANSAETELEKANRTVFLGNVSAEAITSRKAKKALLKHMSSILDKDAKPPQKVESIRFRSTAFATAAMPKRAAYITQEIMESTTKSTNAYVVYSTPTAARTAAQKLNGTIVLDRHLRVDSVAHPAAVDHRRCVFIGNLGMVDDETIVTKKTDEEGNEVTEKRKRNKVPMDVEEGLWRVFGKEAGKVESVRVPRDPVTRVGQGIAYVQFYDGNDVEKAILLEGKKFPPMLPRALRVSRCKAPSKTKRAVEARQKAEGGKTEKGGKKNTKYVPKPTSESQTLAGRASKLLGRSGAAQLRKGSGKFGSDNHKKGGAGRPERRSFGGSGTDGGDKPTMKSPEDIIFEGRRASVKDGKPKDLKFKGSKNNKSVKKVSKRKPAGRGAVRAAKWRAQGKAAKP